MLNAGVSVAALETTTTEIGAVRRMLDWARPGDVLVMPVHDRQVRAEVVELLARSTR